MVTTPAGCARMGSHSLLTPFPRVGPSRRSPAALGRQELNSTSNVDCALSHSAFRCSQRAVNWGWEQIAEETCRGSLDANRTDHDTPNVWRVVGECPVPMLPYVRSEWSPKTGRSPASWTMPYGQAQNEFFGSFRNAISSAVESRFSTALRCGKRPNRSMTTLCSMAERVQSSLPSCLTRLREYA